MKKLWLSISLALVGLLLAAWFAIDRTLDRWENGEWPARLGHLSDVPKRVVELPVNANAIRLAALAAPLGIDLTPGSSRYDPNFSKVRGALLPYLKAELERETLEIDDPPSLVGSYLSEHDAEIDAARDHVLSNGPLVWPASLRENAKRTQFSAIMDLSRVLAARALVRAKKNDARAWDDVHAMWLVTRPQWQSSVTSFFALNPTRMVNGVAMKLPQPEPAWLGELKSIDYRTALAGATQAGLWDERRTVASDARQSREVGRMIGAPLVAVSFAETAEKMRRRTSELYALRNCDVAAVPSRVAPAPWNMLRGGEIFWVSSVWSSLGRFYAELEARERFAALRRGEKPTASSVCSDGHWLIDDHTVRFDRAIAVQSGIKYPLTLTLR